jgi:phospholipid/cholesterol/gamma-HCH transport system substrate-binding protein
VEVAGVPVGSVGAVDLHDEDQVAVVTLKIRSGIELTEDSIASIKTSGLIGDKYVSILPGGAEDMIEPGGTVTETESALDIEGLISKFAHGSVK